MEKPINLNNKNAEKWTLEEAEKLFNKALELSYNTDFDFIGEIARELKTYHKIFKYLIGRFPSLEPTYDTIISNLESNCFSNSKKGNINTAVGIVNLKSNHGWTDRVQSDLTTNGKDISIPPISWVANVTDEEDLENE